jgi:hypothetical protein
MPIQLSRANSGRPLTTADYNSDNLIVETAVNALQAATSSNGTVTSVSDVDTDVEELFSTSIATPTSTPVITYSRTSKAANLVYASPNGTSGKPTMRALVSGDLPIVPFNKGGTGTTTAMTDNKVLSQRSGTIKYTGITAAGTSRIIVTPTTDNFEIDVVPANIEVNTLAATTPLSFAKGGTNATDRQAAINSLTSTGTNGQVFTLVSGNGTWANATGISSVNGKTGASVTLITADIAESVNLYYTDTRVTNNATVVANTAKVTNATHTGDVTGSGALTIANNVVTYAKMQAISATKRLLGRITAGSGNTEEIAISGNLQMSSTDLIVKTSKITTITAAYSILNTDGTILVNASSIIIVLPQTTTVSIGDEFIIKNIAGATSNTVRVYDTGNDLIDGDTNYTGLNLSYNCVTIKYGSSNRWYVINKITGG